MRASNVCSLMTDSTQETLGVPVVSYSETDDFPAFYSRKSGFKSPWRVDDPQSAARILRQSPLGFCECWVELKLLHRFSTPTWDVHWGCLRGAYPRGVRDDRLEAAKICGTSFGRSRTARRQQVGQSCYPLVAQASRRVDCREVSGQQ